MVSNSATHDLRRCWNDLMRRLATAITAAATLFLLTGCFTMKMDLEVSADDDVSGTMILAVDESFAEMADEDPDSMFDTEDLPEGAEVEPYTEDGKVGQKVTFSGVPLEEWNSAMSDQDVAGEDAGEDTFSLVHDGDRYVFEATMDMSSATGDDSSEGSADDEMLGEDFEESMEELMAMMLKDAEFTVAITFPGDVVETNGEVDGRTVTWDLDLTAAEKQEMNAVAEEPGEVRKAVESVTPDGVNTGLLVGIGALVLVGLGLVALVLVRRKNSSA